MISRLGIKFELENLQELKKTSYRCCKTNISITRNFRKN